MGSKRTGVFFGAIALVLLSLSGAALYASTGRDGRNTVLPSERQAEAQNVATVTSLQLLVEPQDGITPVERLLESASSSIDVIMYEFEDPQLEQVLAARAKQGIAVRVILDNGYFGAGSAVNEAAFDYLQSNGVQVHWSPQYFALTHEKSLIIDSKEALIMTFNLSPQYYKSDRDFGVLDPDPNDVAAIEQAFDSDWNGQNAQAQSGDDLVWSPGSRGQILSLINAATSSLDIYNEEMQDPQIMGALEEAARRGVTVEVDMSYAANWKSAFGQLTSAGVHVRTYGASAPLYIHAKVIIVDGTKAFIGSENFSPVSLDQNRELGIIVTDPVILASLNKIFRQDWQGASPFAVQ